MNKLMKLTSILTRVVAATAFLLASLWAVPAATLYSDSVLADAPVLYWNFDEPAGVAVQQVSGPELAVGNENDLAASDPSLPRVRHADMTGGLPRLGNAAAFYGYNYLLLAGPSLLPKSTLMGAYIIEFWAQSASPETGNQYLINFGDNGGNAPAVIYNFNAESVELYTAAGRTGSDGPSLDDTAWHHWVFVNHATTPNVVDYYRDGVLVFSGPDPNPGYASLRLNLRTLLVGAATPDLADPFYGALDELAVYDVGGLSPTELASHGLYLATNHFAAATNPAGPDYSAVVLADNPLVYYNFDETDGDARQCVPYTHVSPNANDLAPAGAVSRVRHADIGSGLLLGNAFDNPGGDAHRLRHIGGWDTPVLADLSDGALPGPWAVEMWMQLKETGQAEKYLFTMGGGGQANSPALIYGYKGQTIEAFGGGAGRSEFGIPLADTNWHHLLLVEYQPGASSTHRVDLYLDGVLHQNMGGTFNQVIRLTDWMYVGSSEASSGGAPQARFDEIAIYDLRSFTDPAALQAHLDQMVERHYLAAHGATPEVKVIIDQQPQSTSGTVGGTASFSVQASAVHTSEPLTYQWYRNGRSIADATNSTYTTPVLTINDIGTSTYTVRVTAGPASTQSQPALLTVPTLPPAPPTAYAAQILRGDPLLYWSFDEWTGPALQQAPLTRILPTIQNDLVAYGNAFDRYPHDTYGYSRLGNYVYFGGGGHLEATDLFLPQTRLSGPYIIEFWAQLASYGMGQYLMNFGSNGGNSPGVIYDFGNSGYLELYAFGNGRTGDQGPLGATDGLWHHYVLVNHANAPAHADNLVECYLDGVLVSSGPTPFSQVLSLDKLLMGVALTDGADPYYGSLDEMAVYDLAGLAPAAVADRGRYIATNHFAAATASSGTYSATVLADNPYLYYDFNEAEGNALQKSTVAFGPVNNDANRLEPIGEAGRVRHSEIGSGLPLGNAADFNGFAFFHAAALDAGRPALSAPWAVEFWVQVTGDKPAYLLNFDANQPAFIYGFAPAELALYAAPPSQPGQSTTGGPVVTDAQWHHVLWVYYGDGVTGIADGADIYFDGVKLANVRNTFSSPLDLLGSLTVGGSSPGYDGFKGRLDELAVYDLGHLPDVAAITAKAEQLVASHYAGLEVRPILQWSFAAGKLTLSWDNAGFVLQANSTLDNPAAWTDVPDGGTSPVTITPLASDNKFYRLRRQ